MKHKLGLINEKAAIQELPQQVCEILLEHTPVCREGALSELLQWIREAEIRITNSLRSAPMNQPRVQNSSGKQEYLSQQGGGKELTLENCPLGMHVQNKI